MSFNLFQPQTSPHSIDPSFFTSKTSFTVSAEPAKPVPDCVTESSPLVDRIAYYQAWVADERASEVAAQDAAPALKM